MWRTRTPSAPWTAQSNVNSWTPKETNEFPSPVANAGWLAWGRWCFRHGLWLHWYPTGVFLWQGSVYPRYQHYNGNKHYRLSQVGIHRWLVFLLLWGRYLSKGWYQPLGPVLEYGDIQGSRSKAHKVQWSSYFFFTFLSTNYSRNIITALLPLLRREEARHGY